jgi:hypothetical protein
VRSIAGVQASDVQAVYSGPEGDPWKLIMGEPIEVPPLTDALPPAVRPRLEALVETARHRRQNR